MDFKKYQLFINGKSYGTRGLDLAFNPHNGNILGEVVLVSESVLKEKKEEEDTVELPMEEIMRQQSS
jgi:hypothetical protein